MDSAAPPELITLGEAQQSQDSHDSVSRLVIILGVILLMILPFITTFNEFLTRIVEITGLDVILTRWIVPFEVRMMAVILGWIGIPAQVSPTTIYLDKGSYFLPLLISWNCVGWQSFILFAATLFTGLAGPYTKASKLEATFIGFLGTFLMNILRMVSVAFIAFYFGQLPAVVYHDYGGTIIILAWLFTFWWICHNWLLDPLEELPPTAIEERTLMEIFASESVKDETQRSRGIRAIGARIKGWRKPRT